jgi:HD-GYP domain-containing protein (c-di-GMP phosphodiesterase class II)
VDDLNFASAEGVFFISTLDRHDWRTRWHSERVRLSTEMLAEELGLRRDERQKLQWVALLRDLGKSCA